jgi:hypothetical protein
VARRADTRPAKLALRIGSLPIWSCSVWGLPCPLHYCGGGALLPHLFTLTQAFPLRRYVFCGTSRQPTLRSASRTLSGTLLFGVRTFLPHFLTKRERPSGPAAYTVIICEGDCWLRINSVGESLASSLAVWVGHSCPTCSPRSAVEKFIVVSSLYGRGRPYLHKSLILRRGCPRPCDRIACSILISADLCNYRGADYARPR